MDHIVKLHVNYMNSTIEASKLVVHFDNSASFNCMIGVLKLAENKTCFFFIYLLYFNLVFT